MAYRDETKEQIAQRMGFRITSTMPGLYDVYSQYRVKLNKGIPSMYDKSEVREYALFKTYKIVDAKIQYSEAKALNAAGYKALNGWQPVFLLKSDSEPGSSYELVSLPDKTKTWREATNEIGNRTLKAWQVKAAIGKVWKLITTLHQNGQTHNDLTLDNMLMSGEQQRVSLINFDCGTLFNDTGYGATQPLRLKTPSGVKGEPDVSFLPASARLTIIQGRKRISYDDSLLVDYFQLAVSVEQMVKMLFIGTRPFLPLLNALYSGDVDNITDLIDNIEVKDGPTYSPAIFSDDAVDIGDEYKDYKTLESNVNVTAKAPKRTPLQQISWLWGGGAL